MHLTGNLWLAKSPNRPFNSQSLGIISSLSHSSKSPAVMPSWSSPFDSQVMNSSSGHTSIHLGCLSSVKLLLIVSLTQFTSTSIVLICLVQNVTISYHLLSHQAGTFRFHWSFPNKFALPVLSGGKKETIQQSTRFRSASCTHRSWQTCSLDLFQLHTGVDAVTVKPLSSSIQGLRAKLEPKLQNQNRKTR